MQPCKCVLAYLCQQSKAVAKQKLDYIHFNPVNKTWKLSKNDLDYYYSSARFYDANLDEFGFLHNLYTVFDPTLVRGTRNKGNKKDQYFLSAGILTGRNYLTL